MGVVTLLTVGHGRMGRADLGGLLVGAGVDEVVDVRRSPGSRGNPDVLREELERWLPLFGVAYRWEPRLGGRRRLDKAEDAESPDRWWRVPAFRAYAGHTRTADFGAALEELLAAAARSTVAIMCSESLWWRCHRRLIADVALVGHGVAVEHLLGNGRLTPHSPSEGARRGADGTVVWAAAG
jgi:uncharacterized protein (DUF488 family)